MSRPRQFDRSLAVRKAMEAFWELGYEGASTAALESRMGIGRSSLYAAFGSKDGLYAEAMDCYVADLRSRVIAPLQADGPALRILQEFFLGVADRGGPDGEPLRCCMIVRACVSANRQPPEVERRIRLAVRELDDAFQALVERAVREGTLPRSVRARDAARFLTTTFQALNVAAHAGRSREEMRELIGQALSTLEAPADPTAGRALRTGRNSEGGSP